MRAVVSVLVILIAVVAFSTATPAHECESGAGAARETELLSIPGARIPMDGVLSGGQPTPEQIEAAAEAGFGTVINLRMEAERGFEWEAETVERLEMERLDAALVEAASAGPVLLHCASGNRIGAILALRAAWIHGVDAEVALRLGLANGMTRLEPTIRELLGLESDVSGK
jgi:protein tyrosine phosphatase (PTP) superfamily phosphohydrolase (DUF442 family)